MKKNKKHLNGNRISQLFRSMRYAAMVVVCGGFLLSCSGDNENKTADAQEDSVNTGATEETAVADEGKGIGPVSSLEVGDAIDEALASEGKIIFEGKCSACHQLSDQKIVGPGLAGVTERRKPEWIMNMIINPEEMTKKDPEAKKLLSEHLTQMTNQNISESDARALLEFLRQNDKAS